MVKAQLLTFQQPGSKDLEEEARHHLPGHAANDIHVNSLPHFQKLSSLHQNILSEKPILKQMSFEGTFKIHARSGRNTGISYYMTSVLSKIKLGQDFKIPAWMKRRGHKISS